MSDEETVDRRLLNNPFCPYCGGYSTSKPGEGTYLKDKTYKRTRTYRCKDNSNHIFHTNETIVKSSIMVRKRDGSDEVFDRRKVFVGIKNASCDNSDDEKKRDELYKSLTDKVTSLLSSSVPPIKNAYSSDPARVKFFHSKDIGSTVLKVLIENASMDIATIFALGFYKKDDLKEGLAAEELFTFICNKFDQLRSGS